MNRTMTALEWALLIVLSMLWGSTFLFITIAARQLPPVSIAAVKVTLAAGALLLAMRQAGARLPRQARTWRDFAIMGLFNDAGPFILIAFASPVVATGLASVLIATSPLFTVVLAHWLTEDERMTPRHAAGVLIGFAGLAVMLGGGDFTFSPAAMVGQIGCLLASLGYAYASVFGRRFTVLRLHPMTTAAGQLGTTALVLVPLALVLDRPWTLPGLSWPSLGALLALGLLTGALAYSIFYRILATAGATNVVLVTFMSPITAILLGIAVLGERLTLQQGVGMLLIGVGIAVLDGRPVSALARLTGRAG
jgi:drug/metabolite transporter (DMT)-like permease